MVEKVGHVSTLYPDEDKHSSKYTRARSEVVVSGAQRGLKGNTRSELPYSVFACVTMF
jgi:hypothetical protein